MKLKAFIRRQFRKKARVYIMPTRMGGYFNGLIVLMFLLAIGYSNNLLLIFTLVLFTFNLLWLIQSHFHLHRLKLAGLTVETGHVADPLQVTLHWARAPQGPLSWKINLEGNLCALEVQSLDDNSQRSTGEIMIPRRGEHHWKYVRVSTSNPFGLYKVWIFYPLQVSSLAYPALKSGVDVVALGEDLEGELATERKGIDDFRGFSLYQHQESRHISWKHYARSGELLVKEGEEKKAPVVEFELNLPESEEAKESYLSLIATRMVECHRREIPFSLKAPGHMVAPGLHMGHLHDCLKVLALC